MRKNEIEKYEDIILKLTELTMKANRVTNHHFFMNFSGHVDLLDIFYLENGYKEGIDNRVSILSVNFNFDKDSLAKLYKCKQDIIALMRESENNG